jgi:hypothetical protein
MADKSDESFCTRRQDFGDIRQNAMILPLRLPLTS